MKLKTLRLISISIVLTLSMIHARKWSEENHREIVVKDREKRQPYGIVDICNDVYPYVVSIQKNSRVIDDDAPRNRLKHICGGTVIGSKYVLTSARCLKPNLDPFIEDDNWSLYVLFGSLLSFYSYSKPGPYQTLHKVSFSFKNPKFPQIDLAILVTGKPFSFSVLPMVNIEAQHMDFSWYILPGWGKYYKANFKYNVSNLLLVKRVNPLKRNDCPFTLENDMEKFVDEVYYYNTICAQATGKRFVGKSMIGSPIVLKLNRDHQHHMLIGILSREFIDISKTPKLLITDTQKSVEWIRNITLEGEKKWPSINVSKDLSFTWLDVPQK